MFPRPTKIDFCRQVIICKQNPKEAKKKKEKKRMKEKTLNNKHLNEKLLIARFVSSLFFFLDISI